MDIDTISKIHERRDVQFGPYEAYVKTQQTKSDGVMDEEVSRRGRLPVSYQSTQYSPYLQSEYLNDGHVAREKTRNQLATSEYLLRERQIQLESDMDQRNPLDESPFLSYYIQNGRNPRMPFMSGGLPSGISHREFRMQAPQY